MIAQLPVIRYFRKRSFKKQLAERSSAAQAKNTTEVYIHKVGILYMADSPDQRQAVSAFERHLKKKRLRSQTLCYLKSTDHPDLLKSPVYTAKDIKFNGVPETQEVDNFINSELDVLFVLSDAEVEHQLFITAASRAKIKVGSPFSHVDHLDIVVDFDQEDSFDMFFQKAESIINSLCPVQS